MDRDYQQEPINYYNKKEFNVDPVGLSARSFARALSAAPSKCAPTANEIDKMARYGADHLNDPGKGFLCALACLFPVLNLITSFFAIRYQSNLLERREIDAKATAIKKGLEEFKKKIEQEETRLDYTIPIDLRDGDVKLNMTISDINGKTIRVDCSDGSSAYCAKGVDMFTIRDKFGLESFVYNRIPALSSTPRKGGGNVFDNTGATPSEGYGGSSAQKYPSGHSKISDADLYETIASTPSTPSTPSFNQVNNEKHNRQVVIKPIPFKMNNLPPTPSFQKKEETNGEIYIKPISFNTEYPIEFWV